MDRTENFRRSNGDMYDWLRANAARFDFANSLLLAVHRYGSLTTGQMIAARKCMARAQQPQPATSEVNAGPVQAAFDKAASKGLKRPKLRFSTFECSLAPSGGRNPGAIYVKGYDDLYIGKIVDGKFTPTQAGASRRDEVVQTFADPLAAAVAYGRRTGNCSCCGRELTDPVSVERGIGPICASKYGW